MNESQYQFLLKRYPINHPYHLPIVLARELQLKPRECFALQMNDISLRRREVVIRREVIHSHGRFKFRSVSPRHIPMNDVVYMELRVHLELIRQLRIPLNHKHYYNLNGYLSEFGLDEEEVFPLIIRPHDGSYISQRAIMNISKRYSWFKFHELSQKIHGD